MREQLVVARGLPAQGIAQRKGIDRDQEQPGLPEIVLARRLRDLGGGGKMNVSVAQVVAAPPVNSLPFGLAPDRGGSDFVDRGHVLRIRCLSLSLLGFSRANGRGTRPDRKGGRALTQASES